MTQIQNSKFGTEDLGFGGSGFPRPEPVEGQARSCGLDDSNDFNVLAF
jgi:hypothetical protein